MLGCCYFLGYLLGVFLVMTILAWIIDLPRRRKFKERFPPISDAEFLARCDCGIDATVALKVRKLIAESLGVEYERIHPSSRLQGDLGAE